MANKDIRDEIKRSRVFQWEVAEVYGISETNFSKMLRKELSEDKKTKIRKAIETLRKREVN